MGLGSRITARSKYAMFRLREILFAEKVKDPKRIPIIINNYNRLTFPRMLIEALENRGYSNIYIIDNASTYPPLLEYYKTTPYKVFRLEKNVGYLSLWKSGIYKQFRNRYFVYTDPDVIPVDECPHDFMEHFLDLLKRYPRALKVGFSLKTDDLPDHFRLKEDVIKWESQFWKNEMEPGVYRVPVDTTFALYRPNALHQDMKIVPKMYQLRTGAPYTARHMPWYVDSDNLSDEERYYIDSCTTSTHWTEKS